MSGSPSTPDELGAAQQDTPRTDERATNTGYVRAEFARQLERELNAAREGWDRSLKLAVTEHFAKHEAQDALKAASTTVSESRRAQPIETAPKDDPDGVLAYCPTFYQGKGGWIAAAYVAGLWHANPGGWTFKPTHWMPLPGAPK